MASRTNELHYTAHLQPWLAATAWGDSWLMTALVLCPDFRDSFSGAGLCLHVSMIRKDDTALCSGQVQLGTIHAALHIVLVTPATVQPPAVLTSGKHRRFCPVASLGRCGMWGRQYWFEFWWSRVKCLHEKMHFWNKNCSLCHKAQGGRTPIINDTAPFSWKVWYCHPK